MDTTNNPAAVAHHARSPETWARAREHYLSGVPAPEVCARYGIALSTFRERARREGWRRTDQDDPPPFDYAVELDADGQPPGPGELAADAWEGLVRCIRQERPREAHAWLRLHQALVKMAEHEADRAFHAAGGREPAARAVPAGRTPPAGAPPLTLEEVGRLDERQLMARLHAPGVMGAIDDETFEAVLARIPQFAAERRAAARLDDLDDLDAIAGSPMTPAGAEDRLAA